MDQYPVKSETRALATFALLLFFLTELVVIAALWSVPNGSLNLGIATKYIFPFLVSLPMAAGIRGFIAVRRRMLSSGCDGVHELSRQFLTTIIIAYAVIIFMVSAIQG